MRSKFIQIAATTQDDLYALDDQGRVWKYDFNEEWWGPFPTIREGEKPVQPDPL